MTPDIEAIGRPLKYYRTNPTKARDALPVDRKGGKFGAGIIRGVSLLTVGEAMGHNEWVDGEFAASVAGAVNQMNKGAKARFTHPSVSGDGLGRYMGRAFDGRYNAETGQAVADIHLAKAAHDTPDGDLASYVMGLAEEDPEAFAISIAFERDRDAEAAFAESNTADDAFESPDVANTNNYPHVRLKALIAADFVDSPAANPGGLFHQGEEIADEADRLCAYALGLSEEKPELACFDADADRVAAFAQRFLNSRGLEVMSKTPEAAPEQPQGETVPKAEYDALAAQVSELKEQFAAMSAPKEEPQQEAEAFDADAFKAEEQKRLADLYKLASSSCVDDPTETAEKWASQGLSVVEAKAALADRLLSSNALTADAGSEDDDPHAKYRVEFRESRDQIARFGEVTEEAYIRSRLRDEGKDVPYSTQAS